MPSPQQIKLYLEAVEMHRQGKRGQAAQILAESLGASEPSQLMIDNIDKLLEQDTMPNDAMLKILSTEVAKNA